MAAEYKLSYTAQEIDTKLSKIDKMVTSINNVIPDENGNVVVEVPEVVQPDWNQTDEASADFIKNKPDEFDALEIVAEMGFIEPVADENGNIYANENGNIYTLI